METIKISQLDALTTPDSNDIFPIVDSSANETKKISLGIIKNDIHDSEVDHLVNVSNEVDEDYRVNFLKSKNLFNANNVLNGMGIASGGTITSATDNGLFYIPVIAGKTYVFSFTDNGVSGDIVWGYTSQVPANGVSCTYNVIANASLNGATFTPTGTQKYLCIRLNTSANNQYNSMGNIQLEVGSTATSYEPYIVPSINVDGEEIYSKPTVLWQNNNVAQAFDGQQITLNDAIENYEFYQVIYRIYYNSTGLATTGRLPIEKTTLFCNDQYNRGRNISAISGTNITFGVAYYYGTYGNSSVSTNNNYIIPYQVIGYGKKATSSSQTRSIPVEEPEENSR